MLRFILSTSSKDLRRRLADPSPLALWLALPILLGGLISLLNGGSVAKAHLLVVDHDASFLSQFVLGAGRQGRGSEFLDVEEVTAELGAQRIAAGDATALLTIPKGFQDAVLNERPTELTLLTNPAQRILPVIIEEGLKIAAEAAFYAQRLFGRSLRQIVDSTGRSGAPTDDFVAATSRTFNQDITRVRTMLLPPVINFETKAEPGRLASLGFGTIFLPGLLFMSVLFMANSMSLDIWVEKERGTLRRAMSAPQPLVCFLAGKLLASVILIGAVTAIAMMLAVVVFDAALARVPLALAWGCYTGGALFCYFILIQLLATTARGAGVIGQLVVFPLMMLGGSFFPFDVMPEGMAAIGRWTPNGLAVTHLRGLLFGPTDVRALGVATVLIGVPASAAFLLAVVRLRRRFATN